MVDEARVDLARGDGLERRHVVLEDARLVRRDRLQPLARPLVALLEPHRRDHCLEGGVRGASRRGARARRGRRSPRSSRGARPPRGPRCCRRRRARGRTSRPSDPSGSPKRSSTLASVSPGSSREEALGRDRAERAGVLGEEDVRRRVLALLGDGRGQLGAVAVANVELDPGLLLELLEEVLDEILLPARVDGDVAVLAAAGGRREQDEQDGSQAESCNERLPSVRASLQNPGADLTGTGRRDPRGDLDLVGRAERGSPRDTAQAARSCAHVFRRSQGGQIQEGEAHEHGRLTPAASRAARGASSACRSWSALAVIGAGSRGRRRTARGRPKPTKALWTQVAGTPRPARAGSSPGDRPDRFRSFRLNRAGSRPARACASGDGQGGAAARRLAARAGRWLPALRARALAGDGAGARAQAPEHQDLRGHRHRRSDAPRSEPTSARSGSTPRCARPGARGTSTRTTPTTRAVYVSYYGRDLDNVHGVFVEREGDE